MDPDLIIQVLNYHGQEFRRALDSEAPSDILENVDMREVDYLQYHRRAKEFGFQERKRRQKLHKFLGKKAHLLYTSVSNLYVPAEADFQSDEVFAVMPPLETYVSVPGHERRKLFYEVIKKGDPVIGKITALQNSGFVITLICTDGGKRRDIHDLGIKCFCTITNALANNIHDNAFSSYHVQDLVRGAILNELTNPAIERLYISMKVEHLASHFQNKLKMGLIAEEDLPVHYRRSTQFKDKSYSELLEWNLNFNNPTNIYQLGESIGLNIHNTESVFNHLHSEKYGKEEFAYAVRKLQSAKWAFKSIEEGVSHFKAGNYIEAFQCLNKALHIDPDSIEGLVARGALYANNNNLVKAVEDFERALEINPQHGNAQKYLAETLVAIGKCCEEKGDIDGACKNYKRAISINGNDEAKEALALAEKSLNSKETIANVASSSPDSNLPLKTNSTTQSFVHADTRQKLLFLLQDDKEKEFGKEHQLTSTRENQFSPPPMKTSTLLFSPKNSYEGTKAWLNKDAFKGPEENIPFLMDRKDNMYEKKKCFGSSDRAQCSKDQLLCVKTKAQDEEPVSLEERLKEYYKKVGENEQEPRREKVVSPGKCYKISRKSTKCAKEFFGSSEITNSSSIRHSSFSTFGNSVTKNRSEQPFSKVEHKRHVKTVPFSDHSNSSCKQPKSTSENRKHIYDAVKNKYSDTINGENCSKLLDQYHNKGSRGKINFETKRSHDIGRKVNHQSSSSISQKNLEPMLNTLDHCELRFRKSQLTKSSHNLCRKSSFNYNHLSHPYKHSYNTSSRHGAHSSSDHHKLCNFSPKFNSSQKYSKSRYYSSENKHYKNYHNASYKKHLPSASKVRNATCELNTSQNLEAYHRDGRYCIDLVSRAPDPEKLKELRQSAKFSSSTGSNVSGVVQSRALEAAMAAAKKINEALQDPTPPLKSHDDQMEFSVTFTKQRETLQQMEMFLENLKSQKKTETVSNSK